MHRVEVPPCNLAPFKPGVSRLGIDVGGVISGVDTDEEPGRGATRRRRVYGGITPNLDQSCIVPICMLVRKFGPENTFILSKCGEAMMMKTVKMLNDECFFEQTGLLRENVIFCTQRWGICIGKEVIPFDAAMQQFRRGRVRFHPLGARDGPRVGSVVVPRLEASLGVGKGGVARALRLTHMIDDRQDCLASFYGEGHLGLHLDGSDEVAGAVMHFGSKASSFSLPKFSKERWYSQAMRDWRVCPGWEHVLECLPPPLLPELSDGYSVEGGASLAATRTT